MDETEVEQIIEKLMGKGLDGFISLRERVELSNDDLAQLVQGRFKHVYRNGGGESLLPVYAVKRYHHWCQVLRIPANEDFIDWYKTVHT